MEKIKQKILIFRFGAIGDVVHSTALYRAIKRVQPEAQIHYLTFKTPSALILNDSDLEKVWICESKSYKYLLTLGRELKRENFDLVINLQPSVRTRIFTHFIGGKKTHIYKKTFKLHAVENFLITAKPSFKELVPDRELKLYIDETVRERVSKLVSSDKKVIGFNVGANFTRQGRRWPINHWVELAKLLLDRYKCEIILTGSSDDEDQTGELSQIEGVKSFCGKLSLTESAALLSACDFVISGDTGPLHIATAVGTTVIGLYGSMPVNRTGPWGEKHFALTSDMKCIPCNRRKCKHVKNGNLYTPCMECLLPERILSVVDKLL